mgnify:CR=1 FL=1
MRKLLEELKSFEVKKETVSPKLSIVEERIYRSLKTQGERAIKGRDIRKHIFEAKDYNGVLLSMILEGRHAMSVCRQVKNMLESIEDIDYINIIKTKNGAYVYMRAKNGK